MKIPSITDSKVLDLGKIGNWELIIKDDFNSSDLGNIETLIIPNNIKHLINFGNGFTGLRYLKATGLYDLEDSFNNSPLLSMIDLSDEDETTKGKEEDKKDSIFIASSFKQTTFDSLITSGRIALYNSFSKLLFSLNDDEMSVDELSYWGHKCRLSICGFYKWDSEILAEGALPLLACKSVIIDLQYYEYSNNRYYLTRFVNNYTRYIILNCTKTKPNEPKELKLGFTGLINLKYVFVPANVKIDLKECFVGSGGNYGGITFLCERESSLEYLGLSLHKVIKVDGLDHAMSIIDSDMDKESKLMKSVIQKSGVFGITAGDPYLHPSFLNWKREFSNRVKPSNLAIDQAIIHKVARSLLELFSFDIDNSKFTEDKLIINHRVLASDTMGNTQLCWDYCLSKLDGSFWGQRMTLLSGDKIILSRNKTGIVEQFIDRYNGETLLYPGDVLVHNRYCRPTDNFYCTIHNKPCTSQYIHTIFNFIKKCICIYIDYNNGHRPLVRIDDYYSSLAKTGSFMLPDDEGTDESFRELNLTYHMFNPFGGNILVFNTTSYTYPYELEMVRIQLLREFVDASTHSSGASAKLRRVRNIQDFSRNCRMQLTKVLSLEDWKYEYPEIHKDLRKNLKLLFSSYCEYLA